MASSLSAAQSAAETQRQSDMAASLEKIAEFGRAADLEKKQYRRWTPGDVYAPHDLTSTEMKKWRGRQKPNRDAFDVLGMNPLDEYKVRVSAGISPGIIADRRLEFRDDVGVYDGDGSDKALKRDRVKAGQPKEGGKGDSEGDRYGDHAEYPSASADD